MKKNTPIRDRLRALLCTSTASHDGKEPDSNQVPAVQTMPDGPGVTFKLESVALGGPKPPAAAPQLLGAWAKVGRAVEASSPLPPRAVKVFDASRNLFAEAVHCAFYEHYPLVLTPDVIWIAITQGFGHHMEAEAEKLRSKFVDFDGKKTLIVSRPGFVKGSPANDWTTVFPEFAEQIGQNIGKSTKDLLMGDFSTTGPTEHIVSCISLMDSMKHYFEFEMRCGCGFPSITLKGTPEDWAKLRAKAAALEHYDLAWWTSALDPVLGEFVAASAGRPNLPFWRSLCNFRGSSGMVTGPITGWLQVFFPYLNAGGRRDGMARNAGLAEYRESMRNGVDVTTFERGFSNGCGTGLKLDWIPPGLSKAPFKYVDLGDGGKNYKMVFAGGFTCVTQDPVTLALEPVVGWAVLDA